MKDAIQILLAAALGAALLYLFIGRGGTARPAGELKIIRDTSFVERARPRTLLKKIRASKFAASADSAPAPARFTAAVDTVANSDTISLGFSYPEKEFSLKISHKPDTLASEKIIIIPENVQTEERSNSWLVPAIGVGAAVLGILLGLAIN